MAQHHTTGKQGEQYAVECIVEKGYTILERNWRFKRGEIDIIAEFNNTIIFVEVKTRSSDKYGFPEQAVTPSKQHLLAITAEEYMFQKKLTQDVRFDVIAVIKRGDTFIAEHLEDAFFANPTDDLF
ncbi:MAG: YraN family protein [Chitinophagales bacterium]